MNSTDANTEQVNEQAILAQARLDDMLQRYGECCTQMKAAHILGKSVRTIFRMLEDGRLLRAGSDVDVRSIVQYLETPRRKNFSVRAEKKRPQPRNRWKSFTPPSVAKKATK